MLVFLQTRRIALVLLVLVVLAGAWMHYFVVRPEANTVDDIYFDFLEAQRVVAGQNPYERILSGDMRTNQKYATYLPLFYLLSAGVVKLGLREFPQFMAFWRLAFLFFNIGSGIVLFYLLWPRRGWLLAAFGVLFWFFSRWNLQLTASVNIDYPPVFLLLLSFWLLPRHRLWAFVVLGLSLGFKQLDVILVPLFLIVVWQSESEHRIRALLVACVALASTLVITSAPFLVANPEAFLKSMAFEAVRNPATHVYAYAPAPGVLLGLSGGASRLPFFVLVALVYALFWRRKIGFYTGGLLTLAAFINFSPVLFLQYFVWLVPFFPLAASEAFPRREATFQGAAVAGKGDTATTGEIGLAPAFLRTEHAALALLVLFVLAGAWTHYFMVRQEVSTASDIYYDFLEAQRVVAGQNPYERILSGDMRTDQKYATSLPLFYLLSAGVVKLGLQEFPQFMAFWRLVFLLFNVGSGIILFYLLWPRRGWLLAAFGVLFWFFSRWSFNLTSAGNIDYPGVFFLLLSFWLLPRHRLWAFVVLGLSLGFMELGVILVPLFLIAVWQSESRRRIRAVLVAGIALASTLVITSAPFLVASPGAFLRSMVFEWVRDPAAHVSVYASSLGVLLGWSGGASRLPFFVLAALVYALLWRRKIGFYTAGLLTLAAFINFSPVLFLQYFVWLVPFFPLAASESSREATLAADAEIRC